MLYCLISNSYEAAIALRLRGLKLKPPVTGKVTHLVVIFPLPMATIFIFQKPSRPAGYGLLKEKMFLPWRLAGTFTSIKGGFVLIGGDIHTTVAIRIAVLYL
jgi:hypothetical protein